MRIECVLLILRSVYTNTTKYHLLKLIHLDKQEVIYSEVIRNGSLVRYDLLLFFILQKRGLNEIYTILSLSRMRFVE